MTRRYKKINTKHN